ncbi:MAG: hypothetical protein R6W87_04470 [Halospina sp.]
MKPEEYTREDATGLARLIHEGQVQPGEVVDAAINRAEQLNPALNAICQPQCARQCGDAGRDCR